MKSRMKDTLLLVGDSQSDRPELHNVFESHYNLLEAENAAQGMLLLEQNNLCIVAVLADIPLSRKAGMQELGKLCNCSAQYNIPVISLVTPLGTGQREEMAFLVGVADVVHKPYTTLSIQRRVQVLVDLHLHQWHLEKLVEVQGNAIRNTNQSMVDTLSAIIEHRSTESGYHVLRIRRFTHILLQEVARCCPEYQLDDAAIDRISSAAALHDIGKISIPDGILNKPDVLTKEEFEIMKTHTTIGAQLTEQIGDIGDPMYLRYIYNICLYHHERWDGRGYPQGLKENDIPICAQVVGLVDAYDALTTPRVYKPAFSHKKAVNMILNGECGAFSPQLLECFKRVREKFQTLAHQYADGYSPKSDDIRLPLPAPIEKEHALSAMELSQLKYQTILHHLNDTIIELDVGNHNYHVVYNPDPDFVTLFSTASFEEMSERLMADGAHPEGAKSMAEMRKQISEKLFVQNQRKFSFRCQIYSHLYDQHFPYEITMLRVNTGAPEQKIVIAVFHNLQDTPNTIHTPVQKNLPDSAPLYNLSSGALCCRLDSEMTILQGAGTLLSLTGYSAREITSQFSDSLLALVLPEDREILQQLHRQSGGDTQRRESEYRILRKNGTPVWVLDRACSSTAPDGSAVCYHLFTDISASKLREEELKHQTSFHQTLVDLSEGVIVEWNLKNNTLYCSNRWQQRFGYRLSSEILTPQMDRATHIHPDDLPLFRQKLGSILSRDCTDYIDLRIANDEGRYLWSRIRAKSTQTAGEPRINAIIYDIDELKRDALSMKKQAQLDSLTKLLNKASAQQSIMDYLENQQPGTMAALLVMDLDNFKSVNDSLGHLYGDAVLTQVGTTLRNLFRSQDIIGRIGGDEFLILLKDIPNKELVLERCQLMVDTFRELLHRLMPKLQVSVSVGAALSPNHGATFADLFHHADESLYAAKRAGKCQYHLYSTQDAYQALSETMFHTNIDSDEQPTMNDEGLIRFVFRQLYESRDIDTTINELLAFIGTQFNVSRTYIFENNEDNTTCSNTFEWCNEGISPEKDNLQNLSYLTDLAGWPDVYGESGVLYCADINELEPRFRDIVEPQGIKSMLHCAIMDRGVFRGYVGFDECTANYLWTQTQVSTLQFLAEVLAVFLIKHRADGK